MTSPNMSVGERMAAYGESRCSTHDILSLLVGDRDKAWNLMMQVSLLDMPRMPQKQLRNFGLTKTQASRLQAALGLARRLQEERFRPGTKVASASDVAPLIVEMCRGEKKESFITVQLDSRHRVQSVQVVSVGSLSGTSVCPREVFAQAMHEQAKAIVLAHNHPSGDASPSPEDRRATDRLTEVGEILGIPVLDHVVVGSGRFYSFADRRYHTL